MNRRHTFPACLLVVLAFQATVFAKPPEVIRTPNGGLQPQALFDDKNVLHVIYLKGKEGECDLFYVRREPGKKEFSPPLRVNSEPGTAVSIGTIRGGQMALGKNGRLHVVWYGSNKAEKGPNSSAPMLYTRMADDGKSFEPQRNLMKQTFGLDGGGTVAADTEGNVFVSWHALEVGSASGEENRKVWLASSADDGKTFTKERTVSPELTGACGCCGMRGFADSKGALHLLYRSAGKKVNRDMYLLTSADAGKSFESVSVQAWKIENCPLSSEAFAEGPGGVRAAWETGGEVYFTTLAPGGGKLATPINPPGGGRSRKHPALAVTPDGKIVMAWAEGTGWNKGGSLSWLVFDKDGKPTRETGKVMNGIAVWGAPAVAADGDGNVVILH
jgi:hypothetical protein